MTGKRKRTNDAGKLKATRDESPGENLSQAALDAMEESVHVVDSDLRIRAFNERFREWCAELEIDIEDIIGKNIFDALNFLPATIHEEYDSVFRTGKPVTTDEVVDIGGRNIYTRTRKQPVIRGREVTHVVTIVSDITEYRTARRELKASEDQYGLVMESVPVSVSVIDNDGVFLYINSHGARNFGMEAVDVLGHTLHDFIPPELANQHLANVRRVISEKTGFKETVHTRLGTNWVWYDVTLQPFAGTDGTVVAALAITSDITQYKDAIDALRESEERFRRQFQASPLPTYIWDYEETDFRLTAYNRAAHAITRGRIEKFMGMVATEMYAGDPQIFKDLKLCLQQKKTIRKEMPYHFQSTGDERILAVYYVFVPPNQVLVHTEDITERRRSRDELQKAHDELERRVRERTAELATMNEALRVERESLRQKNIALNEVLDQIEDGKRQLGTQIQANINRIALPILKSLENRVDASGGQYIELLRSNLKDIAAPLSSELEKRFADLTPRELEICHMVQKGLSCKEIAVTFNTALQTVLKQRSAIRKKLGIANKKVNLETFLKSL